MLFSCGICLAAMDADETSFVHCGGTCDKRYHTTCANISDDLHRYLKNCPGLSWKCTECTRKCFSIDQVGLMNLLQEKYAEMLVKLDTVFDELKNNVLKAAEAKLSNVNLPPVVNAGPSYSEVLNNKTQPAVLIKPKAVQTTVKTKCDVSDNISTVDMQLSLSRVKGVKDGGMVVGFSSKEDNSRFKRLADEKLSQNYEIVELKGVQPRIKIVGMTQIYKENEIEEYVEHAIKNNCSDINLTTDCKFIKLWPTKKNPKMYQAIVQLDMKSYDNIISAGGLFIGYDHCTVYEAVEIIRCYNCNGFHHNSKRCKSKKSCPRCAMDENLDHAVADCDIVQPRCINCLNAIKNEKLLDINPNHAAWDTECPMYKKAVDKFKKDLLFRQ